jgi:hypothetical protein
MDSCGTQLRVQKDITTEAASLRQLEHLPSSGTTVEEAQDDEVVEEDESLLDVNRYKTTSVLPMGEGPHNCKSFLLNSRNHILWRYRDSGPLYLISLSMVQQLAFSDNHPLAEKIRSLIPPRFLEMIDRQDPLNPMYYSNPDLISVLVLFSLARLTIFFSLSIRPYLTH